MDVHTMQTPSATITTIQTGVADSSSGVAALTFILLATVVGPVVVLGIVGEVEEASFASVSKSCVVNRGAAAMVEGVVLAVVADAVDVELEVTVVIVVVLVVSVVVVTEEVVVVLVVMVVVGQRPSPGWQSGWSST